eukprot:scaffold1181_cov67-Cyclotella_meneghiniana.AAC.10
MVEWGRITDEWGGFTDEHDLDAMTLEQDGVIQAIMSKNPAIYNVVIGSWGETEDRYDFTTDWENAGKCLGESLFVKHLKIHSNALELFDSVEDVDKFFNELATNTSLESLNIVSGVVEDMEPFEEKMFHGLLPLFANNTNLRTIESMNINGAVEGLTRALIEVCPSLTSIALSYKSFTRDNSPTEFVNIETTIQTICKNSRVQHISINGNCLFSKSACLALVSLLEREDCVLRCLVITGAKFVDDKYGAIIAHGLSMNKSLKRLKLCFTSWGAMRSFIKPLRNRSIEKITLSTRSPGYIDHDDMTAALQSMSAIQSINIRSMHLPLKSIISIFSNSANLCELETGSLVFNDEVLQELMSIILPNSSFKVLNLMNIFSLSITGWCSLFNHAHKSRLEKLYLHQIPSDSVMLSLCLYLASNQEMKDLEVEDLKDVTLVGWHAFANMLASHQSMEKINLLYAMLFKPYPHNALDLLANALRENSHIKCISLAAHSISELETITSSIAGPTLEELILTYGPTEGDFEYPDIERIEIENVQCNTIFTNALRANSSLKLIRFINCFDGNFTFQWQSFIDILCDKSSIIATYNSHHALESIVIDAADNYIPVEVYSMLRLNRNTNKHAVAREKILLYHSLARVNFVPTSLPIALAWVDKSNSCRKLSQMYNILRKVPDMIQNSQRKRKAREIESPT